MATPPRTLWRAFADNPLWRRVYLARSASLLGTWLNTLAIVHLLGEGELSTALPLAIVFVLKQAPVTFLGPAAGVVADRIDRRRVMIVCDLISAAVVLCFLLSDPGTSLVLVYALTLLQVCVTAFFDPAYRAVIPDLVPSEDLLAVNAIGSVTWSAMFALGTALGGVILFFFGWRIAIVIDAASYLVSALLIASVHDQRTRPPSRERKLGSLTTLLGIDDVREGLRYLRDHADTRHILLTKTVWGSMGALTLFLTLLGATPAYRLSGSGDLGISFLWFCRAVGTGGGPLIARWYAKDDPRRLRESIVAGFVVALVFYVLVSFVSDPRLGGLFVVIAHLGGATVWVMSTVMLQQMVPSAYRGRTFATELGLVMLTSSLSYLAYAALIDYAGLSLTQTIRLAAGLCAVFALVWAIVALKRAPAAA